MYCFSSTGAESRASDDLDIIMQRLDSMDQKMTGLDAKITGFDEKLARIQCISTSNVRLINHGVTGGKSGRLLIKYNEKWGTVCDDYKKDDSSYPDHVSDRNSSVGLVRLLF